MSEENIDKLLTQRGELISNFNENSSYPDYAETISSEIRALDSLIKVMVEAKES